MAWVFPVVGKTTWSKGSWMPNTQTHRGRTHAAIDIYAARGQIIVSPISGTVKNFGSGNIGGNWIQIQGSDGNVYYFAHMDKPATLKKGQKVSGGQSIGYVGNSGSARSTETHVHFSVKRNGKAINPISMLQNGIIVPDFEANKTGVAGGSGTAPGSRTRTDENGILEPGQFPGGGGNTSEPLPPEAQEGAPAWFDQLRQYREELDAANQGQADPVKVRAGNVMRGVLQGMAGMVRSAGFQTPIGADEIDDPNMVEREAGEREAGER